MKQLRSNIQAVMAVLGLLVFIVACTNNNQSTKSSAYDSSNVSAKNDTSMDHMQQPGVSKTTAAKKKGKATVGTMAEMKRTETKTTYKPDANGIYDATEVSPVYPGGHAALSDYIANHIDYPQMAIDDNKEGTVNVQFVVDENGKVQNAKVIGSKLGDGLDEEAERVISSMPKWSAGMVKSKPVKSRVTLPITYQIEE